jgi:hypothetical protein
MNFTKRTTFSDDVDEEIYIFKMMIDISERLIGLRIVGEVQVNDNIDIILKFNSSTNKIVRRNKNSIDKTMLIVSDRETMDLVNVRLSTHWGFNRNPNSDNANRFSFVNSDQENLDEELDSYLEGGVMNIPEDYYFQQMLVRDDLIAYEDIQRYLDALTMKSTLNGCVCFYKVPEYTYIEYNLIYDKVLETITEFLYGISKTD